jgi:elongation factor 1-alpha
MGRMGELEATRQVASFEAKMIVVQLKGQIRSGYESTIRCCTADASCRWQLFTKVRTSFALGVSILRCGVVQWGNQRRSSQVDKRTGAVVSESPQFVRRGEAAVVKLTPQSPLYLEPHLPDGHLGRVINYENGFAFFC